MGKLGWWTFLILFGLTTVAGFSRNMGSAEWISYTLFNLVFYFLVGAVVGFSWRGLRALARRLGLGNRSTADEDSE